MTACPTCNTALPDQAHFCPRCGASTAPGAFAYAQPVAPQLSTKAVVALVLAVIPFCLMPVAGLVLGVSARKDIRRRPHELKGEGVALAAIIVGSIFTVIATVGVLAAIAIPNFIKFQARSRQAEAKHSLQALYSASRAAPGAKTFADVGWQPPAGSRYAYFFGDQEVQAARGGDFRMPADVPAGALAAAVGNVDNDATLDVWYVAADGALTHLVDDVVQ